jgi:hypothetical protein
LVPGTLGRRIYPVQQGVEKMPVTAQTVALGRMGITEEDAVVLALMYSDEARYTMAVFWRLTLGLGGRNCASDYCG